MKAVNATHYEAIPTYPEKDGKVDPRPAVHAIVETPKGSPYKFALDADHGIIQLRSVLPSGYRWPFDYGFIPKTRGDDGDPLDVLILATEATFSGCMLTVRLLGTIRVKKDGVENDRYVAVLSRMPGTTLFTDEFEALRDVPAELRREIESFLIGYSEGEGHRVEITGEREVAEALELIEKGRRKFRKAA